MIAVTHAVRLDEAARRITSEFVTQGFWGGIEFKFKWEDEAHWFASIATSMGYSIVVTLHSQFGGYIVRVVIPKED